MKQEKESKPRRSLRSVLGSLRAQVVGIMLLCYFIPLLLLGTFIQTVLLRGIREKTEAALTSGVENAWTLTTQRIDRVIGLSRDAVYDGELTDAWTRWSSGAITDAEYLRLSRSYLDRKYSRENLFVFAAYFPVSQPELYMYTRSGNEDALRFLREQQAFTLAMGEVLDTRSYFWGAGDEIFLVRNLMTLRMECYGMLVLGINRAELFSDLDSLSETWDAGIRLQLDGWGEEGLSDAALAEGLADTLDSPDLRYVRTGDGDDYSLRLLVTVNRRQQYRQMHQFRLLVVGIHLLMIPILLLIARYVQKRIVNPVTLLSDASRRIEAGEWGITVPMQGGDELGDLGQAFSRMSRHIEELIEKTYTEEINLKNAQIQALQSRINPHFLNNALEDINWQARMEGSATISGMVTSLSVLLNASMGRKDRRMVTLREEMEVAEAYIYFVQQRFGEDLTVTREVEENALESVVPLLTIQPVLENAVEHGIAPAGGGKIHLSFCRQGDCLQMVILNTGRAIQPEDRAKIDAALCGEAMTGNHLGLANIANRLRLIYGDRASIHIFSNELCETVVEMQLPQDEG